jgi:DNA polymerase-1
MQTAILSNDQDDNNVTNSRRVRLFGRDYFPPTGAGEIYNFPPVELRTFARGEHKRLLIVYGFVTNHDISKNELHTYKADLNDWGQPINTPSQTVDRMLDLAGYDDWETVAIGYPIHRVKSLTPTQRAVALAAFDRRLEKWIDSIKPERILFLGAQALHRDKPMIGRMFEFKGIKSIWTTCATHFTVNDETTSSLLGEVVEHARTLRRGKNRYTIVPPETSFVMVDTMPKVREMFAALAKVKTIALDTEGDNLNRIVNNLISVQIAVSRSKAYFLPFVHFESPWLEKERDEIRAMLKDFFENFKGKVIGAHLKYECIILRSVIGCRHLPFRMYDVAVGAWAHNENRKFYSATGLSAWALERLERDHGYTRPEDMLAKDQRSTMASQPLERIAPYGVLDVFTPWWIHELQLQRARDTGYTDFERYVIHAGEMPHVFASMEKRGIPVDIPYLLSLRLGDGPLRTALRENKQKLQASEAAQRANQILLRKRGAPTKTLWSTGTAQVFDIDKQDAQSILFFDVLGLQASVITKSGKPSVGKAFLKANSMVQEVADFMAYNEAKKVKTGFVDAFAKIMTRNPDAIATKRIRSSYGFINVLTGRSSSSEPNLQNIPQRGKLAKLVKRQFSAEYGKIIIKQDFNANEVRGYAIIPNDMVLAERFHNSIQLHKEFRVAGANMREAAMAKWKAEADIHIQNVELFFQKKVDKSDPLRHQIKGVIFGTIYGRAGPSLAQELGITVEEAEALQQLFFKKFPTGAAWIAKVHKDGMDNFYAVNIFGGRRHLDGYRHAAKRVHKAMDRRGPNSLIQGPLSQVGYIAINRFERMLFNFERELAKDHRIIAPLCQHIGTMNAVHDSQEQETPTILAPLTSYLAEHAATSAIARYFNNYGLDLNVDFEIEQEVGKNMAEMTTLDGSVQSWREHLLPLCDTPKDRKDLLHNIDIMWRLRKTELQRDLDDRKVARDKGELPKPSTRMLLRASDIAQLRMPDWRDLETNATNRSTGNRTEQQVERPNRDTAQRDARRTKRPSNRRRHVRRAA